MTEDAQDPYAGVKRLRKFLIVVLVIFCLFSLAYSLVTLNFLKQPIIEKIGGPLEINGDIKLGLDGFHPTLVINDIAYVNSKLKNIEMRVPFNEPRAGKPVETRVRLNGLTLFGRPSIDIDLPVKTDKVESVLKNFSLSSGESQMVGNATYRRGVMDADTSITKFDYSLLYPGASGGAAEGKLILHADKFETGIARNMSGHLSLIGGKGKIPGRALALWSGNMLAALLPNDAVVNCAVAEFDMKDGVATATRIGVDTENLNITGTGTIDFNNMYMSMTFTPQPKQAGTVNTAVPLEVSGVFGEVTATPVGSPVAANPSAPSPCQVSP